MELTRENLEGLYSKFEALTALQEIIAIKFNNAMVENKDREIILTEDGKEDVVVKEAVAWEEIKRFGINNRAGNALSKAYPDLFEDISNERKSLEEINKFENEIFGFTTQNISRMDLIKLIQAIVSLEKGKE